jgi:DNA-binding CsgD family transcriptional regulator
MKSSLPWSVLVGREAELARLSELVNGARAGKSGALVLSGEPGVGKTSLCEAAASMAEGMQVLSARGVSSESELPFAGLTELFSGAGDLLGTLPDRLQVAMEAALGLGEPADVDPFAVRVATLGLLAAFADSQPVLCVIDDLQWLDASSAGALAFAARRLQAEGVAMLFATRPTEEPDGLAAEIETLALSGLSPGAAAAVLSAVAGAPVESGVALALHTATRGNPLALAELPGLLTPGQLGGWEPLEDPLPPGPITDRAFRRRIAELSPDARTALLVAAASGTGELALVLAALADLGVKPAALEAGEEARIITVDEAHIEFRHPLLRAASYYGAVAPARRRAHAAVARVLGAGDGRRPWHQGAATLAPDETIAGALEEVGINARNLGARTTSARAMQRAAQLTPDPDTRARRLGEASLDLQLIGRPEAALALAEEALGHVHNPELHADLELVRSSYLLLVGQPREAHRLLMAEATGFEAGEPGRAAILQMTAVGPCLLMGEARLAYSTADRAHGNASKVGGPLQLFADAVLAQMLVIRGETARGRQLLEGCLPFLMEADPLRGTHLPMAQGVSICYMWIEQFATTRALLERLIEAARTAGAPGLLPYPLSVLGELDFRCGAWDEAYSGFYEAVELARETGQAIHLPRMLSGLARIEAQRGDATRCRAHVAESLRLAAGLGAEHSARMNADEVLGLLEFAENRPEVALTHLQAVAQDLADEEVGEPSLMGAAPERIEALVRAGQTEDAALALAAFSRQAQITGSLWATAAAARCNGIMGPAGGGDEHFEAAIRSHDQLSLPFEKARTELCFGEALRRAKRRTQAREHLQRALDTFARLGARPWVERAELELAATGQSARRRDPSTAAELTPQELRVALAIAHGASNREAATALFLSPKTIEFHLGSIYRKLGIRSRSELARLYALPDR